MSNILAWLAGSSATELLVSNREGLWHWTAGTWQPVARPPCEVGAVELVSVTRHGLELTIRGRDGWRSARTDEGWATWVPTVVAEGDAGGDPRLALSDSGGLLLRNPGEDHWTDLGGHFTDDLDDVAAVSHRAGTVDVYVLCADGSIRYLTHAPDMLPQWEFLTAAPTAATTCTVLRAADMVTMTVRAVGLREESGANGSRRWVADGAPGRLVVQLPPQHIAETLITDGPPTSQSRLAGPSMLHFEVPLNTPLVLTTSGILSAMTTLPMKNDPWVEGEATTLELPWRMLLAVQKAAVCRHSTATAQAVDGTTVPMWHTRVLGSSPSGYAEVRPMKALAAELPFANLTPLRNQMARIAEVGRTGPAVTADTLILSPCGAWFSGSVAYPNLDWTHQTAMGRDYYVRIAIKGTLFPFGHHASVISVSQRDVDLGTKTAGLQSKWALVITEPTRSYDVGHPGIREFPFTRVDIEPLRVIPLKGPPDAPRHKAYWLRHPDNRPVEFTVRAWSPDGPVSMQLPMVFVESGLDAQIAKTLYATGPDGAPMAANAGARPAAAGPPQGLIDKSIPLVVKKVGNVVQKVDATTVAVRSITLSANVNGANYLPRIAELEVGVPAITELTGSVAAPIAATFAREVITNPPGALPRMLLDFTRPVPLDFSNTDAGATVAANMDVTRLSPTDGPVVADIPNMTPAQLFDETATLLGVVPLAKVIKDLTSKPRITRTQNPSRTRMTWGGEPPHTQSLKGEVGPFKTQERPDGTSLSEVKLLVDTAAEAGREVLTQVVITNFSVGIPSCRNYYVKVDVSRLEYEVRTGRLPKTTLTVAGVDLGRELAIVKKLGDAMKNAFGGGPSVAVTHREVKVSYALAAPTPVNLGLISVQNLVVQAGLTLSLAGDPVVIDFAAGTRGHPFLLTVMGLGGGGYLELGVSGRDGGGLERFVAGIEFGAMVAMNFGVAQGEVHIFGGVVFVKKGSDIELTGYIRFGGSVRVLGLITVSIELTVSLTYRSPNILKGEARLVIAVDLTFWSTSVEIPASYTISGSDNSALADADAAVTHPVSGALGPVGTSFPWRDYCQAFV